MSYFMLFLVSSYAINTSPWKTQEQKRVNYSLLCRAFPNIMFCQVVALHDLTSGFLCNGTQTSRIEHCCTDTSKNIANILAPATRNFFLMVHMFIFPFPLLFYSKLKKISLYMIYWALKYKYTISISKRQALNDYFLWTSNILYTYKHSCWSTYRMVSSINQISEMGSDRSLFVRNVH